MESKQHAYCGVRRTGPSVLRNCLGFSAASCLLLGFGARGLQFSVLVLGLRPQVVCFWGSAHGAFSSPYLSWGFGRKLLFGAVRRLQLSVLVLGLRPQLVCSWGSAHWTFSSPYLSWAFGRQLFAFVVRHTGPSAAMRRGRKGETPIPQACHGAAIAAEAPPEGD